jgi:hypothetical protein
MKPNISLKPQDLTSLNFLLKMKLFWKNLNPHTTKLPHTKLMFKTYKKKIKIGGIPMDFPLASFLLKLFLVPKIFLLKPKMTH